MKNLLLIILLTFTSITARANIICEGDSLFGKVRVVVSDSKAIISGADLKKPVTISNLTWVWDGHATGLVTGAGFSMKYRNEYGCIRNTFITAGFRDFAGSSVGLIDTVNFAQCRGGTTPDKTCGVH